MDEYIFHHFLSVIIRENERDRHQVGGKRLSLFPTHVSWLFVDWLTLIEGLNWTSWPLYGIRAYVIPHVTQKKEEDYTWAMDIPLRKLKIETNSLLKI